MKERSFDTRLTVRCFSEMEAQLRLAAQEYMVPIDEYCRRAFADRLAKDGYMFRTD